MGQIYYGHIEIPPTTLQGRSHLFFCSALIAVPQLNQRYFHQPIQILPVISVITGKNWSTLYHQQDWTQLRILEILNSDTRANMISRSMTLSLRLMIGFWRTFQKKTLERIAS